MRPCAHTEAYQGVYIHTNTNIAASLHRGLTSTYVLVTHIKVKAVGLFGAFLDWMSEEDARKSADFQTLTTKVVRVS